MRYLQGTPSVTNLKIIALVAVLTAWMPVQAYGQLLYSFETDLEGWGSGGLNANAAITKTQSTTGATQGTQSMALEVNPNFTGDASVNSDASVVAAIAATAGTGKKYDIRTDITFAADSWSGLQTQPGFFSLFMESNSNAGFQRNTLLTVPAQTVRTLHTRTPLTKMFPTPENLGFVQFGVGKNDNHVNGTTGLKYYVDNVHIQEITETPVFSWEGGLEDWEDGFNGQAYQHQRSVTSDYGATAGTSALQIIQPAGGFAWGSKIVLNTAPEAAQREAIKTAINQGDALRFDVTMHPDQFSVVGAAPPGFLNLTFSIQDGSPSFPFYQSFDRPVDPAANAVTTVTIPFDELRAGTTDLKAAGLQASDYLQIAMATNSNGPSVFAIDNFRIIKAVLPGVPGDYNENGTVDAADFVVWRNSIGPNTIPNDPTSGTVDSTDYDFWKSRFGATTGSGSGSGLVAAVPEPTTLFAGMIALLAALPRRRR
jgi:hypothetical protein